MTSLADIMRHLRPGRREVQPDDFPPIGFETRMPHFREGWRAQYFWQGLFVAVLLAAAIGLIVGTLLGRVNAAAPMPYGGPVIKSELRIASSIQPEART